MTKCQVYHFEGGDVKCVERCPDGFQQKELKKENRAITYCAKSWKDVNLSTSLDINRGKRRQVLKSDRLVRGAAIKQLPDRVLDKKDDPPTIKKDESGKFMLDEAACSTAARNAKKLFGETRAYGIFSMWTNAQPKGSKAHESFKQCRDWAYCELQKSAKLSGEKNPAIRDKVKASINKKYPGCA